MAGFHSFISVSTASTSSGTQFWSDLFFNLNNNSPISDLFVSNRGCPKSSWPMKSLLSV